MIQRVAHKTENFDRELVYHRLQGGILKCLEEIPTGQSSCRWPLGPEDKASPHCVKGVSCAQCHGQRTPEEKARLAERHVGARMPG